MDVKHIFIVGPPRTGTTLLARLLAGGEGVLSLSEPFHMHAILHRWVLGGFYWRFQKSRGLRRLRLPNRCTPKRYLGFLREMAGANGFDFLVLKEVFHELGLKRPFRNFDLLDECTTGGAPVVALIRHPGDAAASTLGLLRWLLGKHRGCIIRLLWPSVPRFRNDNHIIRWTAENWVHFADWSRRRRLFVIRYEDLVENPDETLARICEHAGLPFHKRMLEHHRHNLTAFGGGGDPKLILCRPRPIHTESVGRGQSLTRKQYESIKTTCGTRAADFGYSL